MRRRQSRREASPISKAVSLAAESFKLSLVQLACRISTSSDGFMVFMTILLSTIPPGGGKNQSIGRVEWTRVELFRTKKKSFGSFDEAELFSASSLCIRMTLSYSVQSERFLSGAVEFLFYFSVVCLLS